VTTTHIELKKAIELGYKVDRFYRAWHWEKTKWSNEVFRSYVKAMLKLKIHNSKFPDNVKTDKDKEEWAKNYKSIYNIDIDINKVQYNEGNVNNM